MAINAFAGLGNNVAATQTGSTVASTLPGTGGTVVRVYNATTAVAFFRVGTSAVGSAVTTDTFIAAGATEVFSIPPGVTNVASIGAGTGIVYFQRGDGI